jgi:hypothetical protein
MTRLKLLVPATLVFFLVLAQVALADAQEPVSGEGSYGIADDKVVTAAGFILIIFFPLFILCASIVQGRLERRKDERKAAAKRTEKAMGQRWESGW